MLLISFICDCWILLVIYFVWCYLGLLFVFGYCLLPGLVLCVWFLFVLICLWLFVNYGGLVALFCLGLYVCFACFVCSSWFADGYLFICVGLLAWWVAICIVYWLVVLIRMFFIIWLDAGLVCLFCYLIVLIIFFIVCVCFGWVGLGFYMFVLLFVCLLVGCLIWFVLVVVWCCCYCGCMVVKRWWLFLDCWVGVFVGLA